MSNTSKSKIDLNHNKQQKLQSLNKASLIDILANTLKISKTAANKQFKTLLQIICDTLAEGKEIKIIGFGTFKVSEMKAKTVKNPQNGQMMTVPASKRVRFVPGKNLKHKVNNI
jgi:DNA-binding protein HU-beta